MNKSLDVAAINAAWHSRWPECAPIGHELRLTAAQTWVRFHSLPKSKRYAEDQAEYAEVLHRHLTLLSELSSSTPTAGGDLYVLTAAWSGSADPAQRDSDLIAAFPEAHYWHSVATDLSDPDDPVWTHFYLGATTHDAEELRSLLLLVADWGTAGVIVFPASTDWLYHPYDGGGDVIAPDLSTRDLLRARHAEWLPRNPMGL